MPSNFFPMTVHFLSKQHEYSRLPTSAMDIPRLEEVSLKRRVFVVCALAIPLIVCLFLIAWVAISIIDNQNSE